MHLIETTRKAFDPEELDLGEVQPKVTVAEAIKIVQLHGSNAQRESARSAMEEQAANMGEDEINAVRERLFQKLQRLRQREMPRRLAEGWSFDEEHDHMVPPGWVRPAE